MEEKNDIVGHLNHLLFLICLSFNALLENFLEDLSHFLFINLIENKDLVLDQRGGFYLKESMKKLNVVDAVIKLSRSLRAVILTLLIGETEVLLQSVD